MATDVVERVKPYFTSTLVARVSALADEPEPGVGKALYKAAVLVLSALLKRLEQDMAPEVLLGAVRAAGPAEVPQRLSEQQLSDSTGQSLNPLLALLGAAHRLIAQEVVVGTGIRPASSELLLHVGAAAVAGVLGQEFKEGRHTPGEFADWLRAQKTLVDSARLRIAIAAAFAPRTGAVSPVEGERLPVQPRAYAAPVALAAAPPTGPGEELVRAPSAPPAFRWQWGVLLVVALCLGYSFGSGRLSQVSAAGPNATTSRKPTAAASVAAGQTAAGPPSPHKKYIRVKPAKPDSSATSPSPVGEPAGATPAKPSADLPARRPPAPKRQTTEIRPTPAEAAPAETASAKAAPALPAVATVHYCASGNMVKYHASPDCRGLARCSAVVVPISLEEAQEMMDPCKICH